MNKEEILKKYPDIDINESGGPDNFKEGQPIVERDPLAVVIKHPKEELYLLANWTNGWCGFLTGGMEEGDTLEETVRREVLEETGFKNIREIKEIDFVSHGLFFHTIKQVNRLAHYHLVFSQLENLEQEAISEEELAIAKFTWAAKDKVLDALTREDMKKIWRFYCSTL